MLSQFPRVAATQFIPNDIVERAMDQQNEYDVTLYDSLIIGVDVARFGDDAALSACAGAAMPGRCRSSSCAAWTRCRSRPVSPSSMRCTSPMRFSSTQEGQALALSIVAFICGCR